MRLVVKAAAAVVALVGLAVPVSAGSAEPPVALLEPPVCGGPGSGSSQIQTTDGDNHTYYWRVPQTVPEVGGRPVLIWLHGDGGDGSAIAPKFWKFTDPDGAIVVTPNGTGQTWNHRAADGPGPLDSQFLEKLIDQLAACGSVDADQIFVGGSSRGAYMPYYLLQRSGTRDKIAAVAVNAGLLYCQDGDAQCNAEVSTPGLHSSDARILHLHGTNDRAVAPPPTAAYHQPVDWDVDWRVFSPMKLWAQQHGCWTDQVGGPNNGVLREAYQVGSNTARVFDLTGHGDECDGYQLVLVTKGGHVIQGQEGRIWAFLRDRWLPAPLPTCKGRPSTIVGEPGADTTNGTSGSDVIVGLGGNDTIHGRGGNDTICGGAGADKLYGDGGRDQLDAKDGRKDKRVDCGAGRDPKADRDGKDPRPISCG